MSDEQRIIVEADREIWLTVKELARLKRVHEQTVRTWIKRKIVEAERTAGAKGNWRVKCPRTV